MSKNRKQFKLVGVFHIVQTMKAIDFTQGNTPRYNNSLFCESNPFRPIVLARLYCCLRTTHTAPDLADDVVLHSRTAEQFHSSLPLYSQTLTLNCCDSYWSLSLLNTPSVTFFTAPTPPTDTSMICSLSPPGTQRLKSSPFPDAQNHTIFTCQPRHTSL